MHAHILCISDSDKHFASALAEYEKRLGKQLTITNIKPVKHGSREQIIQKETQKIIKKLQVEKGKDKQLILLSREGKQVSTEQFATICNPGKNIIFVIGGPYGLDEEAVAQYIDRKIAFGRQTMPHGLAKLVLAEQIYRVHMLHSGRSYHY